MLGVLVFRPRMARIFLSRNANFVSRRGRRMRRGALAVLVLLRGACFLPTDGTNGHESFFVN